jgi:hypothetical protein
MKGKIFNAQEVQAIIAGNKTQFREVIKPQPPLGCHYTINGNQSHALCFADCPTPRDERDYSKEPLICVPPKPTSIDHRLECPYQVGQKIFCKESFLQRLGSTQLPSGEHETFFTSSEVEYAADGAQERFVNPNAFISDYWKKRPAQHMKQEHSRLTLLIKEIRVEKISEISEEDAIAEGMEKTGCLYLEGKTLDENKWVKTEISDFAKNWNATHKKPEEKFEANPWVWVVTMEVVK